jgi:hypothetical protein
MYFKIGILASLSIIRLHQNMLDTFELLIPNPTVLIEFDVRKF